MLQHFESIGVALYRTLEVLQVQHCNTQATKNARHDSNMYQMIYGAEMSTLGMTPHLVPEHASSGTARNHWWRCIDSVDLLEAAWSANGTGRCDFPPGHYNKEATGKITCHSLNI